MLRFPSTYCIETYVESANNMTPTYNLMITHRFKSTHPRAAGTSTRDDLTSDTSIRVTSLLIEHFRFVKFQMKSDTKRKLMVANFRRNSRSFDLKWKREKDENKAIKVKTKTR